MKMTDYKNNCEYRDKLKRQQRAYTFAGAGSAVLFTAGLILAQFFTLAN